MDQSSGPLPAANSQFMVGGPPIFGDASAMVARLVLFRMPNDHDLMHDRLLNSALDA